MSETIKDTTKTVKKSSASKAKALSASEIKKHLKQGEVGFPTWAVKEYGSTHKFRWISQSKMFNENDEIDRRGYQVLKNPSTGKVEKWGELLLGAMPKEIAQERKEEVEEANLAQARYVRDTIESARDRLRYELEREGYSSPSTKFNYSTNK